MMAYEFTFTPRFQKHFKGLTAQEKSSLKTSWNFWPKILPTRRCGPNASRGPQTFLSAASTWTSALSGITKATK